MSHVVTNFVSNYVKVKDVRAFGAWCRQYDFRMHTREQDKRVAFSQDGEEGFPTRTVELGWRSKETGDIATVMPTRANDPAWEQVEEIEVDLAKELSRMLANGEVCIVTLAMYSTKASGIVTYAGGDAFAIRAGSAMLMVSTEHIYAMVRNAWGVEPEQADL